MDGDKGFEAVRDKSGLCVDKHCGNASPLSCLSLNVALREFHFHIERQMSFRSRIPVHYDTCGCNAATPPSKTRCAGGQILEAFALSGGQSGELASRDWVLEVSIPSGWVDGDVKIPRPPTFDTWGPR